MLSMLIVNRKEGNAQKRKQEGQGRKGILQRLVDVCIHQRANIQIGAEDDSGRASHKKYMEKMIQPVGHKVKVIDRVHRNHIANQVKNRKKKNRGKQSVDVVFASLYRKKIECNVKKDDKTALLQACKQIKIQECLHRQCFL